MTSTLYMTNASEGLEYHHTQEVPYNGENYKHRITIQSHPGDLSLSALLPEPRRHSFSAAAVPPPQVQGVTAASEVKEREGSKSAVSLELVVAWEEVEAEVEYYQLRVVFENTTGSTNALYELQPMETKAVIPELKVTLENSRPCLYIQVKAVTRFMAEGPWSDSVCVELPPPPSLSPGPISSSLPTTRDTLRGTDTPHFTVSFLDAET
jgi:hypothetical protein